MKKTIWTGYGYFWVTLAFFLFSLLGHWVFAWFAYAEEQQTHQQAVEVSGFVIETTRDMLENWQSEFLQLLWQVGGLSILLFVGSPQSKEGSARVEAKIDTLLRHIESEDAERIIAELDIIYPGREGSRPR